MLEFYWSYADYEQVMALTEEMICQVAQQVLGSPHITYQGHQMDLTPPWRRVRLVDGLLQTTGIDITQHPSAESLAAGHPEWDAHPALISGTIASNSASVSASAPSRSNRSRGRRLGRRAHNDLIHPFARRRKLADQSVIKSGHAAHVHSGVICQVSFQESHPRPPGISKKLLVILCCPAAYR
jgi:hypothetical protein